MMPTDFARRTARHLAAALLPALAFAQVPDTTQYVVWNHGREAGEMRVITFGDSAVVRFRYQDRQRGPKLETRYKFGPGGTLLGLEVRGLNATMFPTERSESFERDGAGAKWTAGDDSGRVANVGNAFYLASSGNPYDFAMVVRHLLAQPGQKAKLLPVGEARAFVAAETTVTALGRSHHLRFVMLDANEGAPNGLWLDDAGRVFASEAGWFITVRAGAEAILPGLRAIERAWHAKKAAELARKLAPPAASTVVIRNGDLFDSERGTVRARQSIVITGDRITAIGPADSLKVPAGATVIDATGRTVMPGMWDMHTHLHFTGETEAPLRQLAAGITTIRDVASDIDAALAQRARADSGTILSPRVILAGFIEGPGAWAGPSAALVRTEAEARAWVARYDSLGYKQIKLYNLVHPDLVPTIAEEAHKRKMRLSGHIARGLTIQDAVTLGYDEFQHAAFLFSTFYQDSLYVPRMRAYSNLAAVLAPTFDVDGQRVTDLIGFLRAKGTVVDGTFNIWQDRSQPLPDGTDAVFGPTLAWMGPITQRALTPRGTLPPQDAARAAAASANYRKYLKRLYDAGITLVAGTDNAEGLSFHGELEIYERAGIPAPAVLQIATIIPARVMGDTAQYGSIAVGKVADLAIVAGKPYEHVTDLRKTERVVRAGRVYRTRDLYLATGLTPR
ncbi:MAG: amidohydrolase family protein [Gemmatimonadetes bacterium]|nr:amidohydrolase family protein [Gemmatimonadota bacterium]